MVKNQSARTRFITYQTALIVLLVGCYSAAPQPTPEQGRTAAEAFLNLLLQNKIDDAWESTSAEFKSDEGKESFRDFVRTRPVLAKSLAFVSAKPIVVNDVQRTELIYQSVEATATQTVKIVVGKELDAWKVERLLVE